MKFWQDFCDSKIILKIYKPYWAISTVVFNIQGWLATLGTERTQKPVDLIVSHSMNGDRFIQRYWQVVGILTLYCWVNKRAPTKDKWLRRSIRVEWREELSVDCLKGKACSAGRLKYFTYSVIAWVMLSKVRWVWGGCTLSY